MNKYMVDYYDKGGHMRTGVVRRTIGNEIEVAHVDETVRIKLGDMRKWYHCKMNCLRIKEQSKSSQGKLL